MSEWLSQSLQLFEKQYPAIAYFLADFEPVDLISCTTKKGEPNLKKVGEQGFYLHAQEGAMEEAEAFWGDPFIECVDVLFIFGVGLGYLYDAASAWLKQSPHRRLIFIEDNMSVLRCLFETKRGVEILSDQQLLLLPYSHENFFYYQGLMNCCLRYYSFSHDIKALPSYEKARESGFEGLYNALSSQMRSLRMGATEALHTQFNISNNTYSHLGELSRLLYGDQLFDTFSSVPAIICGAGPSLQGNYAQLKELGDRALIFGAGTGMNLLNANGIFPHFGMVLDPTITQGSRVFETFAYETPFFVTMRGSDRAFEAQHGPALYLTINDNELVTWFEEKLGIRNENPLCFFCSTPLSSMITAHALGCDPIILVGMNLGLSESKHYPEEVRSHPVEERVEMMRGEKGFEGLEMHRLGGGEVTTSLNWLVEAQHFTSFAKGVPEKTFINATEGGLQIERFEYLPLPEVEKRYLKRKFPLREWVEAEVAQCERLGISQEKSKEVLELWKSELLKAEDILSEMTGSLPSWRRAFLETELKALSVPRNLFVERYPFLEALNDPAKEYAEQVAAYFKQTVQMEKQLVERGQQLWARPHTIDQGTMIKEEGVYRFEEGVLEVKDKELGLHYQAPFSPVRVAAFPKAENACESHVRKEGVLEGECVRFYPDGKEKFRCFYKGGVLHGPFLFYSKEGKISAKSYYIEGKREGRSYCYDAEGNLLSEQRFKGGVWHGEQRYFYPTGGLKSSIGYHGGVLQGKTTLYFPHGQKKREHTFSCGKLHGKARVWNGEGVLLEESEYANNAFVGRSLRWHSNGQLACQVDFYSSSKEYDLYMWDEKGKLLLKELYLPQNIGQRVLESAAVFREELWKFARQMKRIRRKNG